MRDVPIRPNGIDIRSPDAFLKRCKDRLQDVLGVPFFSTSALSTLATRFDCLWTNPRSSVGINEGLPLFPAGTSTKGTQYWLGVTARFSRDGKSWFVDQLSVRVYSGGEFERKDLRVRGEWDLRISPATLKRGHAQPHWHVHTSDESAATIQEHLQDDAAVISEPRMFTADLAANPAFGPSVEKDEKEDATYALHLAMASKWHCEDSCLVEDADVDGIATWQSRVVRYLLQQIHYIAT